MSSSGHFLRICDFSYKRLSRIVRRGIELKKARLEGLVERPLSGKVVAMLFLKPSTRTRISFESGVAKLGGSTIYLDPATMQMSRGESVVDTAKVLSSMCDAVVIRAPAHEFIEEFSAASSVPVMNALTDVEHPCQILADIMTFIEMRGDINGRKIAWVGDCNNVCVSWMEAAKTFGFELSVASPKAYSSDRNMHEGTQNITFSENPREAVSGADCVVTDVWYSMGDEDDRKARIEAFQGYTVDAALMEMAAPDAVFMHCLPAHRGEEVAADVIDGEQSIVWIEAENRMHVQMALLEDVLAKES